LEHRAVLDVLRYGNYHTGGKSALLVQHQGGSREVEISCVIIDTVKILAPRVLPGMPAAISILDASKLAEAESRVDAKT